MINRISPFLTVFLIVLMFLSSELKAQENEPKSGVNHSVYYLASSILGSGPRSETTFTGFGYDIQYRFSSPWSVEARANYRHWPDTDRTLLPVCLGPSVSLDLGPDAELSFFGGFGPAIVIGNDYGSVFANYIAGGRFEIKAFGNNKLFAGTSFGQAMAFHPSPFEYLDFFIGIRF